MIFSKELIQGLQQRTFHTKLIGANNRTNAPEYVSVILVHNGENSLNLHFGYNKKLIQNVKARFKNRKWLGPPINPNGPKIWQIPINFRNLFQLEVLRGKYGSDPYMKWEYQYPHEKILAYCQKRNIKLYDHQVEMISYGLGVKWIILAAEMGLGKTLAAILITELYDQPVDRALYIGPKSALVSAKLEALKWRTPINFEYFTYEGIKKAVNNWEGPAPRVVIFDESALVKSVKAQRTKACDYLANSMRNEYGEDCIIIELSGKPAPKIALDWYAQAEIACPGFLSEGNIYSFTSRLGIFEKQETPTGEFPKLVTWRDDSLKCQDCGQLKDSIDHQMHKFIPSINEIKKLGDRLNGLVRVWFKKDCLDLPDKRYHTHELEPTEEMLNLANILINSTNRAPDLLIKLRTLSDGFIYKYEKTGEFKDCVNCNKGIVATYYFVDSDDKEIYLSDEEVSKGVRYIYSEDDIIGEEKISPLIKPTTCSSCNGTTRVEQTQRKILRIKTPKDDLLRELIDAHTEQGRLNVYSSFRASIDSNVKVFHNKGWTTLQADGRGWEMKTPGGELLKLNPEEMVYAYQEQQDKFPLMGFIGNPGSAGLGLTLTAAHSTFFYSNDYNPGSRMQAEDRGHRIGMDVIRGGWIHDVIVLPSDRKVLASLMKSKNLQMMSLSAIKECYS